MQIRPAWGGRGAPDAQSRSADAPKQVETDPRPSALSQAAPVRKMMTELSLEFGHVTLQTCHWQTSPDEFYTVNS